MPSLRVIDGPDHGRIEELETICQRLSEARNDLSSMELARTNDAWPMLSIGTNGPRCVVHLTTKEQQLLTLDGQSLVDVPETLAFPLAGSETVFTRDFINTRSVAVDVVRAFAHGAPWPDSISWEEL